MHIQARGFVTQPLRRVASGPLVVRLEKGGSITGAVLVEPEAEARVEVVLSEGGFVTGRIVDPDGRPLAGRLRLETLDGQRLVASVSERIAADARADGTFAFGPLLLGPLGIAVSAPRHSTRRVEATVAKRGTADLGDVVLETGLAIRGRVRDREGNGLEGASVRARLRRPGERSLGETTSEADGEFVVAGLGPGTYALTAARPGYAAASATAMAGGDPVDLVLEAGGEIAGRVSVMASHPAYAPPKPSVVDVDPEKEPTPVRIVLLGGARVEGRARRAAGPVGPGRAERRRLARGRPPRRRDGDGRLLPARRGGGGKRDPRRPACARRPRERG